MRQGAKCGIIYRFVRLRLKREIPFLIKFSVRHPGHLPIVAIRISEVAAVPAPENILSWFGDLPSMRFSELEHRCDFFLLLDVLGNREGFDDVTASMTSGLDN